MGSDPHQRPNLFLEQDFYLARLKRAKIRIYGRSGDAVGQRGWLYWWCLASLDAWGGRQYKYAPHSGVASGFRVRLWWRMRLKPAKSTVF